MKRILLATVFVLGLGLGQAIEAAPILIEYEATPVSGIQWMYTYRVSYIDSTFEFQADQGFFIRFEPDDYANLILPPGPPPSDDWDPLVFDPDASLASDGVYDALAFVSAPSMPELFPVLFDWLPSSGQPGSQVFEIYSLDQTGVPVSTFTGETVQFGVTSVPEPRTLTLLSFGAMFLVCSLRNWRAKTRP